jgi:hypothetical protein
MRRRFVDLVERERGSRGSALRIQRSGIEVKPTRSHARHQRWLQSLGRDFGRALQDGGIRLVRRCSRILERGDARLLAGKGYLARDGIK